MTSRTLAPWRAALCGSILRWLRVSTACGSALLASTTLARAESPLHARIDELLEKGSITGRAPLADDAEFVRRAYLTLHGVIPTAAQARSFLASTDPKKRGSLIESLVADPQFAKWMAVRLDVMLMERRAGKYVALPEWRNYLEASFAANKPWDALTRELLSNDGADEKTRAAARWALDREADPNMLAKEVSRIFLGRDISCAQCHDHPRIDDYTQREYAGLLAFLDRTYLFQPDTKKPALLGEKAAGDTPYTSVFTKLGGRANPQLVFGAEIAEPPLAPADLWTVPPNEKDKNVRAIPKHSRRAQLAAALGDGSNPAFRKNIANRVWYVVFGRGLVEPLDLQHSANPPTHPELLNFLADEIGKLKFDLRAFIRELALTQAFQRALDVPTDPTMPAPAISGRVAELEKELEALNQQVFTAEKAAAAAEEAMQAAQKAAQPPAAEVQKEVTATGAAEKAMNEARTAQTKAEEALAARTAGQKALAEAAAQVAEALKALPDAADLMAAAKTFQTKADETATALPALRKAAEDKKAETTARQQAVTTAQAAVAAARAKLAEAEQQVAQKRSALDAAAAEEQSRRANAKHAARLAAEAKAALVWTQTVDADRAARAAATASESAWTSTRQAVEHLTKAIADAPGQMANLEAEIAKAQAAAASAEQAANAKRPALAALDAAATKSAAAAAQFAGDKAIADAAAAVKARLDALRAEVAPMEKTMTDSRSLVAASTQKHQELRVGMEKQKADLAAAQTRLPELEAAAKSTRARALETAGALQQARAAVTESWSASFAARDLTPLLPEQLCWSIMQATGVLEQQRTAATTEWDAKSKLSDADKADPAKQAARSEGIEKLFREKLRGHEDQYARSFGGAPGQPQTDFFATPEQALYFENAGVLRSWTSQLARRVAALPDPKAIAEELYLSVLTRMPAPEEIVEVGGAIAGRPAEKKADALTDYAWALVTSVEFRFAH